MMTTIYSKSGTDAAISAATDALTPEDVGAATAAQGTKADASDVHQITLTGPLVLTIPEGHPAGQVYRVALTQDASGGHTVTHGPDTLAIDTDPGASTLVEFYPVVAGYAARYPAPPFGTAAGTIKAGDWKPTAADVTDSTAAGRALLTGGDVAAQRAALDVQRRAVVDVRDFGAVADCNGTTGTDNHAAFAAAIAACPKGGKVWVPPGIYYLTETISIPKAIDFDCGTGGGDAHGRTELVFAPDVTGIHVAAGWWRIGPFSLTSLSTAAGTGHGVRVTGGPGRIEGTSAQGFSGAGFFLDGNHGAGGGNVHKTVLNFVGAYRNRGDGILISGGGANIIRVAYPDLVANYGYGLKISDSSWCHVLSPHFDQTYNGSPGAIYDQGLANTVEAPYFEVGNDGNVVYLDTNSYGFRGTWAKWAGGVLRGPGAGQSIIDVGGARRTWFAIKGNNDTSYRVRVDAYDWGTVWQTFTVSGVERTIYRANPNYLRFGLPVVPLTDGEFDLGVPGVRWKNVHTKGYVSCGTFTTATRPIDVPVGGTVFDTTLGKPIWYNGAAWVDASGATV